MINDIQSRRYYINMSGWKPDRGPLDNDWMSKSTTRMGRSNNYHELTWQIYSIELKAF
ncbi:hypothetical protein BKA60DRAFT_565463 [Fusarium oxysporum]|nr:hypothetical protein BKA60DRAFT_565463 [Fusarium oxysporum]